MKFMFLSKDGSLHGAARRVRDEGHTVKLFTSLPKLADVGVSADWRPDSVGADLVVSDGSVGEATPETLDKISRFALGAGGGSPAATDIALFGVWNGRRWLSPMFEFVALNRMLSGDLGAIIPGAAAALVPTSAEPAVSAPPDYRGPATIWGEEVFPGLCPAPFYALAELLIAPLGQTLYDIAIGRIDTLPVRRGVSMSMQISVPPYPFGRLSSTALPDISVAQGAQRHFWPGDMSLVIGQVGWSGLVGYASAWGVDLREAGRRLLRVLDGINGKDLALQYRIDATAALRARFEGMKNGDK